MTFRLVRSLLYMAHLLRGCLGGQYTIKRYESEKTVSEDDGWAHSKVILKPETTAVGYEDIVISDNDTDALRVIAEFVVVL